MIDDCQRALLLFWGKDPSETLELSLSEIEIYIEVGLEKKKNTQFEQADLKAIIMNAPMMYQKDNKKAWEVEDFLPKNLIEEHPLEYYELLSKIHDANSRID